MLSLKDYTSHLKTEKEQLQSYLNSINIQTNPEDTFTQLSNNVLSDVGTHLCVYAQPTEPELKYGVWFKTSDIHDIAGIEQYYKFKVSNQWGSGNFPIYNKMPMYNIIHNGYLYGFSTSNCVRVKLDKPNAPEILANPKDVLGGTVNVISASYAQHRCGAIAANGDEIYLMVATGTYGNTSTASYEDLIKYNISTNTYTHIASITANPTSMAYVNGKLYLFGEALTNRSPNLYWEVNTTTKEVTGPLTMPQHRYGPGAVAVYQNRYIYLWSSGYRSQSYLECSNVVHCFDTVENSWKQLKSSPLKHCGIGVFPYIHNDKIFLFGMIEDSRYWGSMLSNTRYLAYEYDIATDTYERLPNLPGGLISKILVYYDEINQQMIVMSTTNTSNST